MIHDPTWALTIYAMFSFASVMAHLYVGRRAGKLKKANTDPMVSVLLVSQIIMAINCLFMPLAMLTGYGLFMWLTAFSQVLVFLHLLMMARTLDDL